MSINNKEILQDFLECIPDVYLKDDDFYILIEDKRYSINAIKEIIKKNNG